MMRRSTRSASLVVAACVAFAAASRAQGDRNREFDRLVRQAGAAYEARDSRAAVAALERAYAIRPVGRLLFNLGRAHEQGGDFTTAADYYRRFLATNPDAEAAAVAREALGIAERRAAQQAEARRAAEADQQRALEAARLQTLAAEQARAEEERRRARVSVVTRPRQVTAPVAIAWGLAGVGVVAGGVLGALALSAQSDFDRARDGNTRFDASSTGAGMALGADIAFGTALAAGVTGLVLFLTQPTTSSASPEAPGP